MITIDDISNLLTLIFFFELLAKTLKLLDLTQLVTCNTIQEEKDSHTGKKGTGTRQNVVFSGTYPVFM